MQMIVFIAVVAVIILFFLMNIPSKFTHTLSQLILRMAIGVLLLFFANVFGGYIGLHIPINIFTVAVSTILGVFGVLSLAAIKIFLL